LEKTPFGKLFFKNQDKKPITEQSRTQKNELFITLADLYKVIFARIIIL
jgi:hypothetical protein